MGYNVEPHKENMYFTQGDSIDYSDSVALNSVAFDMTGMQLDLEVYRRGVLYRSFSSEDSATHPVIEATITISTTTYNISDTGFADLGRFEYYLFLTDGTDVMMIKTGDIIVTKRKKS